MLALSVRKLKNIMNKIRPYIENETPVEVVLDKNTLVWLFETILAAKIVKERSSNPQKFTKKELAEVSDVRVDYTSYSDTVINSLINILERKGIV